MAAIRKTLIATSCLALLAGAAYAQQTDWLKGSTDQQLKTLAGIQPGLGTVMIEYGTRFGIMYYSAKGGNWKFAEYQLKEMTEIQEVGETTRPPRAKGLKMFESGMLTPIGAAIQAKDFKKFDTAFQAAVNGCNGCHAAEGFPFIKYVLPKTNPSPISEKP
jgi:hypothetical protein